jgi:predicted metal-dependent enzyme (double-stranded beta helix superfamily)
LILTLKAKIKGAFHVAFFAFAPGFKGRPHDHTGIHCVSAVLRGPVTEIAYTEDKEGSLIADNIDTREKGSIVSDLSSAEKFIHHVENDSDKDIAYSVHIYGIVRGTNFNNYYEDKSINEQSLPTLTRPGLLR